MKLFLVCALVVVGVAFSDALPKKECDIVCTADYTPVCASNGKTYSNACAMGVESCKNGQNLSVVSQGPCRSRRGTKCPEVCAALFKPVCASNGKTYSNSCQFEIYNCNNGNAHRIVKEGEC